MERQTMRLSSPRARREERGLAKLLNDFHIRSDTILFCSISSASSIIILPSAGTRRLKVEDRHSMYAFQAKASAFAGDCQLQSFQGKVARRWELTFRSKNVVQWAHIAVNLFIFLGNSIFQPSSFCSSSSPDMTVVFPLALAVIIKNVVLQQVPQPSLYKPRAEKAILDVNFRLTNNHFQLV